MSESVWQLTGEDSLEGWDADVIDLPAWAPGHLVEVKGSSDQPYDLSVWFWDAERTSRQISGCVSSKVDPQCLVPENAAYAAVIANRGGSIVFSLDIASSDCRSSAGNAQMGKPEVGHHGSTAVVAVIDTGTNLFHNRFRADRYRTYGSVPVRAVDARTGVGARYLPVRQGTGEGCVGWIQNVIEPKTLYRAAGTNLFYISMHKNFDGYDSNGHGSWVTGTVAANAPDVFIVSIQAMSLGEAFEGMKWASQQSWIDVVTSSWAPGGDFMSPSEFATASRLVTDAGKLFVNAAGNFPQPYEHEDHAGPPWVIAVGGADPHRRGEAALTAKTPDVLADVTVKAPVAAGVSGWEWVSGTSVAAPAVAGTLAQAIALAREMAGHEGPSDGRNLVVGNGYEAKAANFRHSMNRNALYWAPTDYDPTASGGFESVTYLGVPINPVAPWLQMGWGYVHGDLSQAIAEGALQKKTLPEKPAGANEYMDAQRHVREAFWGPCGADCPQ